MLSRSDTRMSPFGDNALSQSPAADSYQMADQRALAELPPFVRLVVLPHVLDLLLDGRQLQI